MKLLRLSREDFDPMLRDSHKAIFSGDLPTEYFKYDFAYLTVDNEEPISYCLAQEKSTEVVEMTYGGTVKEHRGLSSKESLIMFLNKFRSDGFEFMVMQAKNTNYPMIRLGLSLGGLITGTVLNRYGDTYVCMQYDLKGDKK